MKIIKKNFIKVFKILSKDNWSVKRIKFFYRFKSIMFNKSTIELKKFMPKKLLLYEILKLIDKITLFIGLPSVIKFKLYNIKELGNDKELKNFFHN